MTRRARLVAVAGLAILLALTIAAILTPTPHCHGWTPRGEPICRMTR
jgi:hypothetical protein